MARRFGRLWWPVTTLPFGCFFSMRGSAKENFAMPSTTTSKQQRRRRLYYVLDFFSSSVSLLWSARLVGGPAPPQRRRSAAGIRSRAHGLTTRTWSHRSIWIYSLFSFFFSLSKYLKETKSTFYFHFKTDEKLAHRSMGPSISSPVCQF